MDNTFLMIILVAVAVIVLVLFLLTQPQERWIEAEGVKIQKIPSNAEIIEINKARESSVKTLMDSNKLITVVGEAQGSGSIQEKEIAKIRAFSSLAEMLSARVQTLHNLLRASFRMFKFQISKKL
ncbi:MAG: hypothetical protein ACP5KD_07960 [Fervidobacterium sp.]|jgi:4-hydroxy-3-methylbut-2-enyl diphosphate reductase IspH